MTFKRGMQKLNQNMKIHRHTRTPLRALVPATGAKKAINSESSQLCTNLGVDGIDTSLAKRPKFLKQQRLHSGQECLILHVLQ